MLPRILPITVAIAVLGLLGAAPSFAQNSIDTDLLSKADKIMVKAQTAKRAEITDLMSQLTTLMNTKGLSMPCHNVLVTMHSAMSANASADELDDLPDEMKQQLKTQADANAKKIETERAACIQAAQSSSNTATAQSGTSTATATKSAEELTADGQGGALRDRLTSLRGKAKSYFEAGDATGLEQVQAVLAGIGKQQDQDMSCRLAATNMVREIIGYTEALKAADDWHKKLGMTKVKTAATLVDAQLQDCE